MLLQIGATFAMLGCKVSKIIKFGSKTFDPSHLHPPLLWGVIFWVRFNVKNQTSKRGLSVNTFWTIGRLWLSEKKIFWKTSLVCGKNLGHHTLNVNSGNAYYVDPRNSNISILFTTSCHCI